MSGKNITVVTMLLCSVMFVGCESLSNGSVYTWPDRCERAADEMLPKGDGFDCQDRVALCESYLRQRGYYTERKVKRCSYGPGHTWLKWCMAEKTSGEWKPVCGEILDLQC